MIATTEPPETETDEVVLVPAKPPLELTLLTGDTSTRFKLSDSGIEIDPEITFEEWYDGLGMFKWMQSKLKVGFADYVTFGRVKFGKERAEQSLAQLEFDMPTVRAALEIGTVPPELRKPGLEAEHYIVLARSELPIKQQTKWAETASAQRLSPNQLKHSIEAGEVVSATVSRQRQTGAITLKGVRQEFDIWMRRVDGAAGIKAMSIETQEDILSDLEPFYQLYVELTSLGANMPKKAKKTAKKTTKRRTAKK